MTALTQDRTTPECNGRLVSDPLATGTTIYAGAMYVLDSSAKATPATAAATTPVRAVAQTRAVELAGDTHIDGALGTFCFDNASGAAALTRTDIGNTCYALGDCTVKKTGTCAAGTVLDVTDRGVWVRVGQ